MRLSFRTTFLFVLVSLLWVGSARAALAGPHLTLSPTTASAAVGSSFVVTIGADTLGQKTMGFDIYTTFDATKLEVVTAKKVSDPSYGFADISPTIDNAAGTLSMALVVGSGSPGDAMAVTGPLVAVTFMAKAAGTSAYNYTCTPNNFSDSNIFSPTSTDIIDCSANDSGSYTLTAVTSSSSSVSSGINCNNSRLIKSIAGFMNLLITSLT